MYICKHFKVHEFVPESIYELRKEKAWQLMDDRLLRFMDSVRELVDEPITINNWFWGGEREWSGLRIPVSPWYSQTSQHTLGRACDFLVEGMTAHEVRRLIKRKLKAGYFGNISATFEEGKNITWVHVDFRNGEPGYNSFNV